ncbi:unnamed protein product [Rotaria sp. Silwood1]|nr:unnamed protein product [Rotaria sp. Silwood1]CAF4757343.1 unnamed protein product [Rotaria sp. Silwood1]
MTGKAITYGPDTVFVAADNIVYFLTGSYSSATWHTEYTFPTGTQINFLYYDELLVGVETGLFILQPEPLLPVELSTFTSSVAGCNVTLSWKTQSEMNNEGYDIERKAYGGEWTKIGFVSASAGLMLGAYNVFSKYNVNPEQFNISELVTLLALHVFTAGLIGYLLGTALAKLYKK